MCENKTQLDLRRCAGGRADERGSAIVLVLLFSLVVTAIGVGIITGKVVEG